MAEIDTSAHENMNLNEGLYQIRAWCERHNLRPPETIILRFDHQVSQRNAEMEFHANAPASDMVGADIRPVGFKLAFESALDEHGRRFLHQIVEEREL